MNLIKWNNSIPLKSPLTTIFDDFFNTSLADIVGTDFTTNQPSVNIIEQDDKYILEVAAPGIDKTDFNVEVVKDQLIISSTTKEEQTEEKAEKFTRREFNFSSFKRSFYMPKSVDKNSVEANYSHGVLSISLNKTEAAIDKAPTKIEIK